MNNLARFAALFSALGLLSGVPPANSRDTISAGRRGQIIVRVHSTDKGLRIELESPRYKTDDFKRNGANFALAELKLHEGGDCQIIEVFDDRAPLSAITEVSEMSINAGFKDIRPFIYWHKTGRMAQVQFGPPIKFSMNGEKIEQRLEKEK
jgi:hypothetical protein